MFWLCLLEIERQNESNGTSTIYLFDQMNRNFDGQYFIDR